jgi:hypothetical protein
MAIMFQSHAGSIEAAGGVDPQLTGDDGFNPTLVRLVSIPRWFD